MPLYSIERICGACGQLLVEPPDLPVEQRLPCPQCGSLQRTVQIQSESSISTAQFKTKNVELAMLGTSDKNSVQGDENEITGARDSQLLLEVGFCIYCGARGQLSDEHVIPFALGGNLILPKSSCQDCAAITSACERRVLRGFMLPARAVGGFPTRKPKDRPPEFQMQLVAGEEVNTISLPLAEFPALLQLPKFEPPAIVAGWPLTKGVMVCGMETIHFGKDPSTVLKGLGATTMRQTTTIDAPAFARMLAKIGYSYAVGVLGPLPLEEVPVLSFIRGDKDDGNVWLGSVDFQTESEHQGALHALTIGEYLLRDKPNCRLRVARVKLFASSGATGYEVVVHANRAAL